MLSGFGGGPAKRCSWGWKRRAGLVPRSFSRLFVVELGKKTPPMVFHRVCNLHQVWVQRGVKYRGKLGVSTVDAYMDVTWYSSSRR